MLIKIILFLLTFCSLASEILADSPKDLIRKGNSSYRKQHFDEAEVYYRKSLEKDPKNTTATFNLGNSLFKQKKFEESMQKYLQVANSTNDPKTKANAYYNLGNSYLKNKQYAESIEFYKKALRLNPKDFDAKYNLEYARRMLLLEQQKKQQQEQKQNQQQQNQQNNSQQNQARNNQKENNQQDRNQQNQQVKMNKEQIENLLNALQSEEKKTQKEIKAKLFQRREKQIEKNW